MATRLKDYEGLSEEKQYELIGKSAEALDLMGVRPLKQMLAYIDGQVAHTQDRLAQQAIRFGNSRDAGVILAEYGGRLSALKTLQAGVVGMISEKQGDTDGQAFVYTPEGTVYTPEDTMMDDNLNEEDE